MFAPWFEFLSRGSRRRTNVATDGDVTDWPQTTAARRNAELDGSIGLHILTEEEGATIDIIAVHGLGANPVHAWLWHSKNNPVDGDERGYPMTDLNWLQKLLPSKLASANVRCRIMVYNYDSGWIMNARRQRLSNISDRLLDSLQNERQDSNRPLIFIAHSFGGNVVEQAIVSASRSDSEWTDIAGSTAGVIFLGTPHRGCSAANWGALIAALGQWGIGSEPSILKSLEHHSDALTDLLRDFANWLWHESIPVVCCFENKPTNYGTRLASPFPISTLVVNEYTACIDGHKRISLDADHFKINKFWGLRDPSFDLVYHEIRRMAQRARIIVDRRRHPDEMRRYLKDLEAVLTARSGASMDLYRCLRDMDVTNQHDFLHDLRLRRGRRVESTCEWILKRPEFATWRDSPDPQLLRLIGPPGIGKTMLSTFLVETLEGKVQRSSGAVFASFFCDGKVHNQRSPEALLRSLIWQLLLQRNELYKHVKECYKWQGREFCFETMSSLWPMFESMIRDPTAGEIYILIDALDECDLTSRQGLLARIHDLFEPASSATGYFKFVITCRPGFDDIEAELRRVSSILRIDSADVSTDLSRYIDFRVDELADLWRGAYAKDEIQMALRDGSGGTFLWASLMIADLKQTPFHRFMAKLKNPLPKNLPELYATILDRVSPNEREGVRFILQIMVNARYPLTKLEISAAFSAWQNHVALEEGSEELYLSTGIFSPAISIILDVIDQDEGTMDGSSAYQTATVHFCHQSFKDFLFASPEDAWYHTSSASADIFIFKVCWTFLTTEVPGRDTFENLLYSRVKTGGESSDITPITDKWCGTDLYIRYPFLLYAETELARFGPKTESVVLESNIAFYESPLLRDLTFARAAANGWEMATKLMQQHGATPNISCLFDRPFVSEEEISDTIFKGYTELIEKTPRAFGRGRLRLSQLLFRHLNSSFENRHGYTVLHRAAKGGHTRMVGLLLEMGANINLNNSRRETPLIVAIEFRQVAVVERLLLEPNIDIGAKNEHGRTALHFACQNVLREVVEWLLDRGAELDMKYVLTNAAKWYALRKKTYPILDVAIERGYITAEEAEKSTKSQGQYTD